MPATYGSGTAGVGWDPRCVPYKLWDVTVPASSSSTKTFGNVADIVIVTAIDVVSDGGGSGGFVLINETQTGRIFWAINVGSNVDTFEWRGFLGIPYQVNIGLFIDNNADCSVNFYFSGLLQMGPTGVPI